MCPRIGRAVYVRPLVGMQKKVLTAYEIKGRPTTTAQAQTPYFGLQAAYYKALGNFVRG